MIQRGEEWWGIPIKPSQRLGGAKVRKTQMRFMHCAAAALLILAPGTARALLFGAQVTASQYDPNLSTRIAGPEGPLTVMLPSAAFTCCTLPTNGDLDVTGSQIFFTSNMAETYDSGSFVGFVLTFSGAPPIVNAIEDSSSDIPISVTFTSDEVLMNFAGATSPFSGAHAIVDVTTGIPEPASLVLFGTALAGLGLIRRRIKG